MSKTIIAYDIFRKEWPILADKLNWRVSVYGLLKNSNKDILFQKNPQFDELNIPGGGVERGEDLSVALSREFLEETGYSVKPTRLLDVSQNLFTFDNQYFQNICIFYEVVTTSDKIIGIDKADGDSEAIVWLNKKNIQLKNIQPIFQNIIKQYLCL